MKTSLPLALATLFVISACDLEEKLGNRLSENDGSGGEEAELLPEGKEELEPVLQFDIEPDFPGEPGIAVIWDLKHPRSYDLPLGEFLAFGFDVPTQIEAALPRIPDDRYLIHMTDGNAFTVGSLWVIDRDTADLDPAGGSTGWGAEILAMNHLILYVRDDVQPESVTAEFVRGTPNAGFHILEVEIPARITCEERTTFNDNGVPFTTGTCPRAKISPAPDDLATVIPFTEMGIDFGEFSYPPVDPAE